MTWYSFTPVSTNRKVGPIPVTYSGDDTCPDVCPLKGAGCYAELGPGAAHWKRVSSGARGVGFPALLDHIRALPKGQLWRMNVAGDLPGPGDELDTAMLTALVAANKGRRGFTYTHKPVTRKSKAAIKKAIAGGFTINLSANSPAHADELCALKVGPVVTLLPEGAPTKSFTPEGRVIIACPAEENDGVTCATCQACAHSWRASIIGFRAHGARKKAVNRIAMHEAVT